MPARRVLLVLVLVLSGLAAVPSGAGAGRPSALSLRRVAEPRLSSEFWTPARLRAAAPRALLHVEPADLEGPGDDRGEPYEVSAVEQTTYSSSSAAAAGSTGRGPIPFQRFQLDPLADPSYAAHGMVFGSSPTGLFSCSGTAIASDNKSVVWTAGHCLELNDQPSENVVFIPGYQEGDEPFGRFPATLQVTPAAWQQREAPEFDFGAFTVGTNGSGQLLGDVVAPRGIAFNQQPTEQLQSFGYPGAPATKFDGEHLQSCRSQGSARILEGVVAMGCDMQEGSSGGGWVMRDGFVLSNQSFGNMRVWPNLGFGPYLGTTAKALYDQVRGGTTPMPTPTPTSTPGAPATHTMRVTFDMDHVRISGTRKLSVTGRMTARDGFAACAGAVPLSVFKRRSGTFYPVGRLLFTDATGRYKTVLPDRAGVYGVFAPASPYDLTNDCTEAASRLLRDVHS